MKVDIGPYVKCWTTSRFERALTKKVFGEYHYYEVPEQIQADWKYKVIDKGCDAWQVVLNYTVNSLFGLRGRKVKVKIHNYDTWNVDATLTPIILPMLKQLKETKQGSPLVDDEDLPPELQHNNNTSNESDQYDMFADDEYDEEVWDTYETRWNYILDSMIFSFEKLNEDDWKEEFSSGEIDHIWIDMKDGFHKLIDGPNHTYTVDYEGMAIMEERIRFGLCMFGKYFQNLWD